MDIGRQKQQAAELTRAVRAAVPLTAKGKAEWFDVSAADSDERMDRNHRRADHAQLRRRTRYLRRPAPPSQRCRKADMGRSAFNVVVGGWVLGLAAILASVLAIHLFG